MTGASVAYVLLTIGLYYFTELADTAVVYANIVNLNTRIAYCMAFISSKSDVFKVARRARISDVIPAKSVVISCLLAAVVTRLSSSSLDIKALCERSGRSMLLTTPCIIHVGVGILSASFVLSSW